MRRGHIAGMRSHSLPFFVLLLAACPMMDDDDGGDEGSTTPTGIAGTVSRGASATIAVGRDGIGTVYVAAFAECSLDAELLGVVALPNADLSDPANEVAFMIDDIAADTVHLAVFLDDDGDADPMAPLPDGGDLVLTDVAGDGVLTCQEEAVGDQGIELVLNVAEPLPGVAGTVRLGEDVVLAEGNDGVGTLFVGAFATCAHDGEIVGFTVVPNADVSAPVEFAIPNLPIDDVHLAFFLDDNANADPMQPLPDAGDPVFADDVEDGLLSCVAAAAGADDLDLVLNNIED